MISVVCRPKVVCLVGAVAFAGFMAWELVTWDIQDVRLLYFVPYLVGVAMHAAVGQVELLHGRLRQRSWRGRWGAPVAVGSLTGVSIRRDLASRSFGRRLDVTDGTGHVSMGLWWWGGWRALVRLLDQAVVAQGLVVDEGTERSLADVAGREPDERRFAVPDDGTPRRERWSVPTRWFSGMPDTKRVPVVLAWVFALIPFFGPITAGSPEDYPGVINLAGISMVLVVLVAVPGLAVGLRYCLHGLIAAAGIGVAIGIFDIGFAPTVAWMELVLYVALAALGLGVRAALPADVRRVA